MTQRVNEFAHVALDISHLTVHAIISLKVLQTPVEHLRPSSRGPTSHGDKSLDKHEWQSDSKTPESTGCSVHLLVFHDCTCNAFGGSSLPPMATTGENCASDTPTFVLPPMFNVGTTFCLWTVNKMAGRTESPPTGMSQHVLSTKLERRRGNENTFFLHRSESLTSAEYASQNNLRNVVCQLPEPQALTTQPVAIGQSVVCPCVRASYRVS